MKNVKNLFKSHGFIAIDTILSCVIILMIILLAMGFYTLVYPRMMLEKETHTLAQKAKLQGGLTNINSQPIDSDVEIFKKNLEKMGYDISKVEVTAKTNPGNVNAIGVDPINSDGTNYIKRDSKDMIEIIIKAPTNDLIKGPLAFFKSSSAPEYHYIRESIMSERW